MDIISSFRRAVRRHPDRTFLFDANEAVTYKEADERSSAIASDLISRGMPEGGTLGLAASDRAQLWLAIIGAWKAGVLPGLIDARTKEEDLPYFVGDVGAPLIAAAVELIGRLRGAGAKAIVDMNVLGSSGEKRAPTHHGPESPLYLSYTSGTTGAPKGAVLLSEPVTLGTMCIADRLGLTHNDILLATTPISSSFQLVAALMPAIHSGAAIGLVAGRPVDEIWKVALETQASVLVAYPLTLADVVNTKPQGMSSPFRLALSGGSPLAPRIKRDYRDLLGIHLIESYGQSELGGFMALGSEQDGERSLAGFVGRPLPDRLAYVGEQDGTELPPGHVGEVLVTNGFFAEYRNKPDKTAEVKGKGVLHTGDVAVADEDGYIKVLGRTREAEAASQRGGFLRELEDAYYDHPDVLHATIVESASGEVGAFVELRPGRTSSSTEIETFATGKVAAGLVPRKTTLLDKMPRTFSGKADRRSLSLAMDDSGTDG